MDPLRSFFLTPSHHLVKSNVHVIEGKQPGVRILDLSQTQDELKVKLSFLVLGPGLLGGSAPLLALISWVFP